MPRFPQYSRFVFAVFILFGSYVSNTHAAPELSVADFTLEPDFRGAKISPNGRYMASVWNKGDLRYLAIQDLSKPDKPVIGTLGDKIRRPKSVTWANNERLLVTLLVPYDTKRVEKDSGRKDDFDIRDYFMFERVISVDIHAKDAVVLLNDQKNLRSNVRLSNITKISNDDKHVLMPARRSGLFQVFKVNAYTGTSERVARGGKRTFLCLIDENGKPTFRFDYYSFANKVIIRKFIDETKWEKFDSFDFDDLESEDGVGIEDLVGRYKGELAYRKRNEQTGYFEIVARDSESKSLKTIVALENQDVERVITDNGEIIGYVPLGDLVRVKYFNEDLQKEYDKLAEKIGNYNFYYYGGKNEHRSVIKTYGRDLPGSFYLYDHKEDTLSFIQDSYLKLPLNKLGIPAQATYKARDNLAINMHLLLPPNYKKDKTYPLVLLPHGGPIARDTAGYDDFAQFIATRGYIVAQPNFRGSTGYGKAFEEAGYKQWGQAMQEDLEDAVDFLVRKGYADKDKVCIAGISYGGYAALMGTIKTPELFKCSISMNGVTHLVKQIKFDLRTNDYEDIDTYIAEKIGNYKTETDMLDANSPALHADKIKTPILLVASTDDQIVPYSQAKLMRKALKKAKKTFEFIKLEDSLHNPFYFREDQELVYEEVEKFLARHLN